MEIEKKIQRSVPLASLTTFKIGGPAEYFVEIKTKEELMQALDWAEKEEKELLILAGGSNLLINDKGVRSLVVKMNNDDIQVKGERIVCGAGASLIQASRLAANQGLSGLEWAIGIPGTVGGAIRGNAGAYGCAIENIIETVEVLNKKRLNFAIFSRRDCRLSYKESILKSSKDLIIWSAIIKLNRARQEDVNKLIENYSANRQKAQPRLPSAGCVFKNLSVQALKKGNAYLVEQALDNDMVKGNKVPVGWIIDRLGLKGKTIGGAKISLEHANFIVNTGKAKSEDVIALISCIKQAARDKFGVQLQEEIEYFGF